jgi:hypothetical protein
MAVTTDGMIDVLRTVWNQDTLLSQLNRRTPWTSPRCAVCGKGWMTPVAAYSWDCGSCHSLHVGDTTFNGSALPSHQWRDPSRHWHAVERDRPRREREARARARRRKALALLDRLLLPLPRATA